MRKVLAVALTEYRQVVLTKSFLLSLLFPLVVYGTLFAAQILLGDQTDLGDRELVVVDRTGRIAEELQEANRERDQSEAVMRNGGQVGPRFVITPYEAEELPSDKELLAELSDRVREGKIFAFLLIGQDYYPVDGGEQDHLQYYSDSPTFDRLPKWLAENVQKIVEKERFEEAGYDRRKINPLTSHNRIERFSLAEVDQEGNLIEPEEENRLAAFLIPLGLVMLIFVSIQMTTPILLHSVIEEKMQRISEVLLASVSPFQLLAGKLFSGVGVGLTFSAVYLLSLALTLGYFEKMEWVPPGTYFWFLLFLIAGMLAFGSLFAGLSAACQDLKDSQNFAGTIILILLVPMMLCFVAIESPDGPLSNFLSIVPPFSIMGMIVRIAIPPGPPVTLVVLSLALNIVFAGLVVWASSRIFRIGILSAGKTPGWKDLLRWLFQRG